MTFDEQDRVVASLDHAVRAVTPMLSILTPAFNESENLPALHARLAAAIDRLGLDWEWVIVDDHSRDDTIGVVEQLTRDRSARARRAPVAQLRLAPRDRVRPAPRARTRPR